jgi:vacuolar-type H+-ATPase subunit H
MRNYWLRIALVVVALFAAGIMAGTVMKRGVNRVQAVVEGTGPLALPVSIIPFKLNGQRLGTISKVVLHRDVPKHIAAVELEVKLSDSLLARGLEGCRLAANFDADHDPSGSQIHPGRLSGGVFSCLHGDEPAPHLQEFGHAVFQPGDVHVPLLLPNDIVDDLKQGEFGSQAQDSIGAAMEATADSIEADAEARAESIAAEAESRADSIVARSQRLLDSLREEGSRRGDSTRRAAPRVPDPPRSR